MSRLSYLVLATALWSAAAVATAAAAETCDNWVNVNGQWYRHCVDDRGRNVCYFCPTREITSACIKKQGSECAR